jgi:hypothetical protein
MDVKQQEGKGHGGDRGDSHTGDQTNGSHQENTGTESNPVLPLAKDAKGA